MGKAVKGLVVNKKFIVGVKIIACMCIITWLFSNLFIDGVDDYTNYKEYSVQNDFSEAGSVEGITCIEQKFSAPGNILSNVSLYFGNVAAQELSIAILDSSNAVIDEKKINVSSYISNSWNRISIDCNKLKRGKQYAIVLSGTNLSSVFLSTANSCPRYLGVCKIDNSESPYTLAVGFQFTYRYWLLGNCLELIVKILYVLALAGILCFGVLNIEKLYVAFRNSEKKQGFLYALYFSVYTVLLFNPIDSIRTEVIEFSRVMGAGLNAGVDVSRRISNFSHWFIYFAIAFCIYFLVANYIKSKQYGDENAKVIKLLDNVMVVANVVLELRCIIYFYNESQTKAAFYYSDFLLFLIMLIAALYILLNLEKKIAVEKFEALVMCGWMIALPVSIMVTHEWTLGREFMGFQVVTSILIIAVIKLTNIDWKKAGVSSSICTCSVILSFIPFYTSFYIELVTLLNQHGIYWVHIRENYFLVVVLGLIVTVSVAFIIVKKKKEISNWKKVSYPAVIFGFACLWVQIAVSSTYNADLFETANSSILISDFLNFGDIPIVQHYGGHMMSGVWEGIIYAILNNDFMGANFSPYAGYIGVVIAFVFYYFVKNIWDEDSAILVVLFFPFYNSISYWGLGILMLLSAMIYIRKNTYLRAVVFWLAFIWCIIYRLDLGFAFILACMIGFAFYIIFSRNLTALKQLVLTMIGSGVIGAGIWFVICIWKGINPVNRLIEFLMINLSNQNWAYSSIGDMSTTKFAFTYIIMPFAAVIILLYTICGKKIREKVGYERWTALIILGFSYFFNFSRGLVRHSLVENDLDMCLWSALMFITVFITFIKENKKLFLPTFAICILCCRFFQTESNFADNSIADTATAKIGNYTETWTLDRFAEENTPEGQTPMTYWAQLRTANETIERVAWNTDLIKTIQNYQVMIDALLDEDETFVDCINKTSIYPLLERENPVYVSQSPLQLSGQFTQEEFVKEMQEVPIVLMPYDGNNDRASEFLDGVPNLYRYYKVFEYVYQNYVPLCTYENGYAIWCLPDRYDEMSSKIKNLAASGVDVKSELATADSLGRNSVDVVSNADGTISINFTGANPIISELQNLVDLSNYVDKNLTIAVDYKSDLIGDIQIYYTTDDGESYTEKKVVTYTMESQEGTAYFKVPITRYSRIRFDTPEGSNVQILSFRIGATNCQLANYGYDGPYLADDGASYSYLPAVHNYSLDRLPLIWAESDKENSVNNSIVSELSYSDGMYIYDLNSDDYDSEGNYLKANINYDGADKAGNTDNDDEYVGATLKVGKIVNGQFETKYYYSFTVKEGLHDYMFRISNDYYWYLDDTDAVMVECGDQIQVYDMSVLEGD